MYLKGGEAMANVLYSITDILLSILTLPIVVIVILLVCAAIYVIVLYEICKLVFEKLGINLHSDDDHLN